MAALETYSTLTRLPPPHRIEAHLVAGFLRARFPDPPLVLTPRQMHNLIPEILRRGITGGSVYDALIALTAADHDAELLTLDQRAEDTYRRCGVNYRLLR